jgi:hypothetical protein
MKQLVKQNGDKECGVEDAIAAQRWTANASPVR